MPHDSNINAPPSAKTLSKQPATPLSEAEFLVKQQADAKKAISRTVDELKRDLVKAADPRAWMQVHPWATLVATTVAGFAAAAATIPSKEQQALSRLEKIEEALDAAERGRVDGDGHARKSSKRGALGGYAFRLLQPMIISTLTGFISGKAAAEPPTGGANPAEAMAESAPPA